MAEYLIQDSTLTNIANSIRGKTGKSEPILTENMATEIDSITGGGGIAGDTTITEMVQTRTIVNSDLTEIPNNFFSQDKTLAQGGGNGLLKAKFKSVKSLGWSAFKRQADITEIVLPQCELFLNECLEYMSSLPKIDLPKARTFENDIFYGDTKLKTVILRSPILATCKNPIFKGGTPIEKGTGYIYVPKALIEQYKVATNWVTYANQFRAIEDYPEITGGAI